MKALISMLAACAVGTIVGPTADTAIGTAAAAGPRDTARHQRTEVTTGRVHTLQGGIDLGYDIRGQAIMIRFARRGQTVVAVGVKGLDPNTTYPTHVHNQPCSATPPGGSHYQHVVGGPVDAVNEMWPVIETGRRGIGFGHAAHEHIARAEAQSIVVHNPADTSIRLACADLT